MQNSEAEGSHGLRAAEPKPPTMSFSGPTVIVKVGPGLKEYHVHKELFMYHSGFFRGALGSKTFASAQDGVVTLEHVDPPVFEGFALFIYHGDVATSESGWDRLLATKLAGFHQTTETALLVSCYVLADELLAPHAKKFFQEKGQVSMAIDRPSYELIAFACDSLPENSVMLNILVDEHCEWWTVDGPPTEESEEDIQKLPAEFLYRVALVLCKIARGETAYCSATVKFHKVLAAEMDAYEEAD